jgi:hypothetical protein
MSVTRRGLCSSLLTLGILPPSLVDKRHLYQWVLNMRMVFDGDNVFFLAADRYRLDRLPQPSLRGVGTFSRPVLKATALVLLRGTSAVSDRSPNSPLDITTGVRDWASSPGSFPCSCISSRCPADRVDADNPQSQFRSWRGGLRRARRWLGQKSLERIGNLFGGCHGFTLKGFA